MVAIREQFNERITNKTYSSNRVHSSGYCHSACEITINPKIKGEKQRKICTCNYILVEFEWYLNKVKVLKALCPKCQSKGWLTVVQAVIIIAVLVYYFSVGYLVLYNVISLGRMITFSKVFYRCSVSYLFSLR